MTDNPNEYKTVTTDELVKGRFYFVERGSREEIKAKRFFEMRFEGLAGDVLIFSRVMGRKNRRRVYCYFSNPSKPIRSGGRKVVLSETYASIRDQGKK